MPLKTNIISSLQFVTLLGNQWLHIYSQTVNHYIWKYWCKSSGYIRNLKSYRIKASRQKDKKKKKLPCWGLIIHHPELQLEHSVIIVPPYGSALWEHNRPTLHLAGDKSWPSSWWDPSSVVSGLCPTRSWWAWAHVSLHLTSLFHNRPYCLRKLHCLNLQ